MYEIDIHHRGDDNPTKYVIYKQKEADEREIKYKHWKSADEGEYGLSDDKFVAKVISKSIYKPTSVYIRFPYGYTFYNPRLNSSKLKASGRKANNTLSGKTHWEVLSNQQNMKNLAMVYAQTLDYAKSIELVFGKVSKSKDRTWKRRMKTEKFKDMVRKELQDLLKEHGLTEEYTLQLLSDTISTARAKGDVTNLMRAVDNLQDMHGMKDKNLIKTTEQIEATSNTKLIDELRETEDKLVATKTTIREDEE